MPDRRKEERAQIEHETDRLQKLILGAKKELISQRLILEDAERQKATLLGDEEDSPEAPNTKMASEYFIGGSPGHTSSFLGASQSFQSAVDDREEDAHPEAMEELSRVSLAIPLDGYNSSSTLSTEPWLHDDFEEVSAPTTRRRTSTNSRVQQLEDLVASLQEQLVAAQQAASNIAGTDNKGLPVMGPMGGKFVTFRSNNRPRKQAQENLTSVQEDEDDALFDADFSEARPRFESAISGLMLPPGSQQGHFAERASSRSSLMSASDTDSLMLPPSGISIFSLDRKAKENKVEVVSRLKSIRQGWQEVARTRTAPEATVRKFQTVAQNVEVEDRLFDDGTRYTGQFLGGKKHGEGKVSSQVEEYIGQWKRDLRDGEGKQVWKDDPWHDGRIYTGQFKGGKAHGHGRMEWHTETGMMVYEGQYINDFQEGRGQYIDPQQRIYDGEWSRGQRDGMATITGRDGSTRESTWRNDKEVGRPRTGSRGSRTPR